MVEILEREEMTPGDFVKSMRVFSNFERRTDFNEALVFSEKILKQSLVGDLVVMGSDAVDKSIFYRQRLEKLLDLGGENLPEKEDIFARVTLYVDGDMANFIALSDTWENMNKIGEIDIFGGRRINLRNLLGGSML